MYGRRLDEYESRVGRLFRGLGSLISRLGIPQKNLILVDSLDFVWTASVIYSFLVCVGSFIWKLPFRQAILPWHHPWLMLFLLHAVAGFLFERFPKWFKKDPNQF